MSWARFDDLYDDNRKIKRAWRRDRAAVGLHAMAVTYCSRHRTDGVVDSDWIEERLPAARERDKTIAVLVDVGLFEPIDAERWAVHDYLEFNPSRRDREDASDAARNAALVRWSKEQDADRNAAGTADRSANGNADRMRTAMPHPSRPVPDSLRSSARAVRATDGEGEGGRRQPSRRVDQDAYPDGLPSPLLTAAERALGRLTALWEQRGGTKPTARGVGLAVAAYPDRDHQAVIGALEHWALAGRGQSQVVKDWARTFRSFLEREPAGTPSRPSNGGPVSARSSDLVAADRRLREQAASLADHPALNPGEAA